jgi:hypothetical protein
MSKPKSAIQENEKNWRSFRGFTIGTVRIPKHFRAKENSIKSFVSSVKINEAYFGAVKRTIQRMCLDVIIEK